MAAVRCSKKVTDEVANHKGYKVTKRLGEGSFGVVYAAHNSHRKEYVAIKICQVSSSTDDSAWKEAIILHSLSSPYVVTLIEYYAVDIEQQIQCALVMEFCALGDLARYLIDSSPSTEQRLVWCYEMAAGLAHIHDKKIVHLDIKPANILITGKGHVKIGDVGLARFAYSTRANRDSSASFEEYYMNKYAGSRPYMAPEVYDRHYQKQSDLFSLGLVFVVMAEKPPGLIPYTSKGTCLGKELNENSNARRGGPTELLSMTFANATHEEMDIYNNMLAHSYKDRIAANDVVQAFKGMLQRRRTNIPQPQDNYIIVLPPEQLQRQRTNIPQPQDNRRIVLPPEQLQRQRTNIPQPQDNRRIVSPPERGSWGGALLMGGAFAFIGGIILYAIGNKK